MFGLTIITVSVCLVVCFFVSRSNLVSLLGGPSNYGVLVVLTTLLVCSLGVLISTIIALVCIQSGCRGFDFVRTLGITFIKMFFDTVAPSDANKRPVRLCLVSGGGVDMNFNSTYVARGFVICRVMVATIDIVTIVAEFGCFDSTFAGV